MNTEYFFKNFSKLNVFELYTSFNIFLFSDNYEISKNYDYHAYINHVGRCGLCCRYGL